MSSPSLCATAITGLALLLGVAGCGFIPKDGPTGAEVYGSADVKLADPGRLSYAMVKISPLVVSTFKTEPQPAVRFSSLARSAPRANVRVGPADTVAVSLFEAGSGGLFVPADAGARPGNFVQIPTQEVDTDGNITIPYGGSIRALGRTPREIERDIVEKLRNRAIEPQAIVTVGERGSNVVSVLGDVGQPVAIPLRPGGLRLLTALARAGGTRGLVSDSIITVQRRGRLEQALLASILKDPAQNIQLDAEDVINVTAEPRIFLAFGATLAPTGTVAIGNTSIPSGRRLSFDTANLTLAEGLAKAGGLASDRADTRAVFLFRYTARQTLAHAGADVSNYTLDLIPTVFTLDLSEAEGYLLANQFLMKHKDILYVSDSPSVDLVKFLGIVRTVTGTTRDAIGVVSDVKALSQ